MTLALWLDPPYAAVTVTVVDAVTAPAWTETPFVLWLAGMMIVEGAGKAVVLLLWIATWAPPEGAKPVIVTLSVANAPVARLDGEIETELRTGLGAPWKLKTTVALAVELPPALSVTVSVIASVTTPVAGPNEAVHTDDVHWESGTPLLAQSQLVMARFGAVVPLPSSVSCTVDPAAKLNERV